MSRRGDVITVLIVDDSSIVRRSLRAILGRNPCFHVVAEAGTGKDAIELACRLKPRLITMDLDMPEGDGLEAIEQIMALEPTRILVVTGVPRYAGNDATFEALSRGALELAKKPTAWPGTVVEQQNLLALAERLASIPVLPHVEGLRKRRKQTRQELEDGISNTNHISLIAIGASTGGPRTISAILGELPSDFPIPIVILQHLADVFASGFLEWLGTKVRLSVREALPGSRLEPGVIYAAVRGAHITVSSGGWVEACHGPPRSSHCPAIDVLFESVASSYGSNSLGILLTGMGRDGTLGLKSIREAGGITLAQDEESCVVFGMPKVAIEIGAAQRILPPNKIAEVLLAVTEGQRAAIDEASRSTGPWIRTV